MSEVNLVNEINKNLKAGEVVEYSEINSKLSELESNYGSVVPDMTTKEGYEFSKDAAKVCRDARTNLESIRKEKKQPYLDYGRLIDSQAKEIESKLKAIEAPHSEAYKAYDAKKKQILEERKNTIFELNNVDRWGADKSETEIQIKMDEVGSMDISKQSFGRLEQDALNAQQVAMDKLNTCFAQAVDRRVAAEQAEADRLELEALRAAQAKAAQEKAQREESERKAKEEIERKEREKRIAEEAEANAKAEAEQLRIAAAQAEERRIKQEEQAKIDAENARVQAAENAKLAAEEAARLEREKIEAQAAALKAETEAREADIKHKSAIKSAILGSLMSAGVTEGQARLVIKLVANRKVPHIQINY